MSALETATAFAPASIGNVAVGFDILGMAVDVLGDRVRVRQGHASAVLAARHDATLAAHAVRVPAGHPDTASLGAMFGELTIERA